MARVGVGAPDDQRQGAEGRVVEAVLVEEGVERTALALVAELDAGHVVGDGPLALGHGHDLTVGHEQEGGSLVHEAADEPRAGDAIDPGLLARDPFHRESPLSDLMLHLYVTYVTLRCN